MRSRLSKYVLFKYVGHKVSLGIVASFKPVVIVIKHNLPLKVGGWYLVNKKPTQPRVVIDSSTSLTRAESKMRKIVDSMRRRFGKLINLGGGKDYEVVKTLKLPFVLPRHQIVYLLIRKASLNYFTVGHAEINQIVANLPPEDKAVITWWGNITMVVRCENKY